MDDRLSAWYKENSRVFVAADHACWSDPELERKISKRRFGTVVRSKASGLNRMMQVHAEEAHEWILDRVTPSNESGDTTEDEESGATLP